MARDKVNVIFPVLDSSKSVATADAITAGTVTQANGTELVGAFGGKDNSLQITFDNTASSAKTVTIKAGDIEPNNILGDLSFPVTNSKPCVVLIENPSRFQNKDGSLYIDYESGFTGTVYAVAKHVGLNA